MSNVNLSYILQLVISLGLLNVWLLRFSKSTSYRGGTARNMKEEFAVYGLPAWSVYVIGALKIAGALALLAGFWLTELIVPAAILVFGLMLGASLMHAKVKDPFSKYVPALSLLLASALLIYLQLSA